MPIPSIDEPANPPLTYSVAHLPSAETMQPFGDSYSTSLHKGHVPGHEDAAAAARE
ncbi:hypothetical protein VTG60DRAFT_5546 [Thermothelomyces hinnuleus]